MKFLLTSAFAAFLAAPPPAVPPVPPPVGVVAVSSAPARPVVPKRRGRGEYPYRADADYFNDFQTVVRSDDLDSVIDRHRKRPGRDCLTGEQLRCREDVLAVLDVIYDSPKASRKALIALASIVASLDAAQLDLLVHVLRGGTFTDYAIGEGVTKAAVGQRWKTIVRRCPALAYVKGDGHGAARHVLDEGVREGARGP